MCKGKSIIYCTVLNFEHIYYPEGKGRLDIYSVWVKKGGGG